MSKNTDLGSLVNYIKGQVTGRLNAPAYTSATAFTGTIAGYLGFDTSGNILTTAGVGFTGSGTTNYVAKFTGSTALGNSLIFDNGSSIGINTTSPSSLLSIQRGASNDNLELIGSGASGYSDILFYNTNKVARLGYIDWSDSIVRWTVEANIPLAFSTNSAERMRIDSSGRFGLGTTSTSGYAMTVTGVDGTNYAPSSLYKIIARFVNNTSENRGIGIGYHTNVDINAACIYGLGQGSDAFPQASMAFAVYNRAGSTYAIKFLINQNTVQIVNIPSDPAGRSTGELYRDSLGYVKIGM